MKKKILAVFLPSLILLTACTTTVQNKAAKENIDSWSFTGKIAIVYDEQDCSTDICQKKSDQGQIQWAQQGEDYHIVLSDPFGRVLFDVVGDNNQAEVVSGDKKDTINNPQQFMRETIKLPVTPTNLRYWLIGRIDPNEKVTSFKNNNFTQKGFSIKTDNWNDEMIGLAPSIIQIENSGDKLKIVVKSWFK